MDSHVPRRSSDLVGHENQNITQSLSVLIPPWKKFRKLSKSTATWSLRLRGFFNTVLKPNQTIPTVICIVNLYPTILLVPKVNSQALGESEKGSQPEAHIHLQKRNIVSS